MANANTIEVTVPDIGDHSGVPVIEVLVRAGERVEQGQGLVTLESDKATMEVPAPAAGIVRALKVGLGDGLSQGDPVALLEIDAAAGPPPAPERQPPVAQSHHAPAVPAPAADSGDPADIECRIVVIGAGVGGYTAAFRAADLGMDTVLVERYPVLGGVCLNVGCIPSKALLHAAAVIEEAAHAGDFGVVFGKPQIDVERLRAYKNDVVGKLTKGLAGMSRQRKLRVLQGSAKFVSANVLEVDGEGGPKRVRFEQCVIAAGSQAAKLPGFPWDDPRMMDSTDALELRRIPARLLVVGGGIIGLEMATVYRALGSQVTVAELGDRLMPGADPDLVEPLAARLRRQGVAVHLNTRVVETSADQAGIVCRFAGEQAPATATFDQVLVAVGRVPNGDRLQADKAGVRVSARGFIEVDEQMRSNVPHIFAVGDIVGQPMLAHKAAHEGKLAAEVAAGRKRAWVARVIPSVAFTDPEVAWVGVTETEAKARRIDYGVGKFPWIASGRAIGVGRAEGFTKLIFDRASGRVIGGGIVGVHAGDLISEVALAIEMGAEAGDIGHTIHPHPTLGESIGMAAEVFEGTVTDLYVPPRR